MNERELDNWLKQGRQEAGRFFGSFQPAHKQVGTSAWRRGRRSIKPRAWGRLAAAVLCVMAAGICALLLLSGSRSIPYGNPQTTGGMAEQTVALGNDKEYRMNYIPTGMQEGAVPGIMTVLWELNNDGNEQMAYYSVFEYCDTVYPAMIIPFSGADYDMLLIASGDSAEGSIAYRLVGCNADAIETWWSRDDILGGTISVSDGVAVEKAAADGTEPQEVMVTYIVPIQIVRPGVLALPVSNLKLGVGEQVLLIGSGVENVNAECQNGLLSRMDTDQYGASAAMFRAVGTGEDVLYVGAEQNENLLSVSIGEK